MALPDMVPSGTVTVHVAMNVPEPVAVFMVRCWNHTSMVPVPSVPTYDPDHCMSSACMMPSANHTLAGAPIVVYCTVAE